jgi:hypothetical protein
VYKKMEDIERTKNKFGIGYAEHTEGNKRTI